MSSADDAWLSQHRIGWTIDQHGTIEGTATCDAPSDAYCRTLCVTEGCNESGCGNIGEPGHEREPNGYGCDVATFLEAEGKAYVSDQYDGGFAPLRSGAVVVRWDGDTYLWHYPAPEQA